MLLLIDLLFACKHYLMLSSRYAILILRCGGPSLALPSRSGNSMSSVSLLTAVNSPSWRALPGMKPRVL